MRRIRWILIIFGLMVVFASMAGGVALYVIYGRFTHPPEQTAQYLPEDTRFYYSLNLRPGVDQLSKLKHILSRFEDNKDFQDKLDDIFDLIKDESSTQSTWF